MRIEARAIWITWEKQIRNQSMAQELGVPLYEFISERTRMFRYVELSLRTLGALRENKPEVLFVQNPSIVLSFIAILVRPFFGFKAVVDCHNSGLHPLERRSRALNLVADWIAGSADLTIVTNAALASEVHDKGGKAFVMPDPLPNIESKGEILNIESPSLLFICTWALDEPYREVMEAAEGLDATIYITGNYRKAIKEDEVKKIPNNVVLLGFVDRETYDSYLNSVDLVVDLTTRDNCLVCGAYEAVSAEKPMVISDTKINREVFNQGAIYTENDSVSVRRSVLHAISDLDQLAEGVAQLKKQRQESTCNLVRELKIELNV